MEALRKLRDAIRNVVNPSPACDRCGKPTGKPWLYQTPSQWWRCEPCEREVVDILVGIAREGRLTGRHMNYIRRPSQSDD